MQNLLLVLLVVAIVFGLGVVAWSRRRPGGNGSTAPLSPTAVEGVGARSRHGAADGTVPPGDSEVPAVEASVDAPLEEPTFRGRMARARGALAGALLGIRTRSGITPEVWDELEEALLRADVGVRVTGELLESLRPRVAAKEISDPAQLLDALRAEMASRLGGADRSLRFDADHEGGPNVWLFVGVNGVGKTTSVAKIAHSIRQTGRTVLLAAADTFRAGAVAQLETWSQRLGVEIVKGAPGADPAAVAFDATAAALARGV
ncbi:MAG: signal recognition particle receptor subunit alpha, partial [Ilumatobacteraceae bacterium]